MLATNRYLERKKLAEARAKAKENEENDYTKLYEKTKKFRETGGGLNYQADVDINTLGYEWTKYLGGDLQHTHLVKGLDYALLQKARKDLEKTQEQEFEQEYLLKQKEKLVQQQLKQPKKRGLFDYENENEALSKENGINNIESDFGKSMYRSVLQFDKGQRELMQDIQRTKMQMHRTNEFESGKMFFEYKLLHDCNKYHYIGMNNDYYIEKEKKRLKKALKKQRKKEKKNINNRNKSKTNNNNNNDDDISSTIGMIDLNDAKSDIPTMIVRSSMSMDYFDSGNFYSGGDSSIDRHNKAQCLGFTPQSVIENIDNALRHNNGKNKRKTNNGKRKSRWDIAANIPDTATATATVGDGKSTGQSNKKKRTFSEMNEDDSNLIFPDVGCDYTSSVSVSPPIKESKRQKIVTSRKNKYFNIDDFDTIGNDDRIGIGTGTNSIGSRNNNIISGIKNPINMIDTNDTTKNDKSKQDNNVFPLRFAGIGLLNNETDKDKKNKDKSKNTESQNINNNNSKNENDNKNEVNIFGMRKVGLKRLTRTTFDYDDSDDDDIGGTGGGPGGNGEYQQDEDDDLGERKNNSHSQHLDVQRKKQADRDWTQIQRMWASKK